MSLKARLLTALAVALLAIAPIASLSAVSLDGPRLENPLSSDAAPGLPEALTGVLTVGMAIRVKDAGTVARKWVQRAAAASPDYAAGVKDAAGDWEANTIAGRENFALGVQAAISDGRYERGVREAGGAKFAARASTIGAQRFAPGVQASEGEMAKGVAPVLQAIAGMTLPPRRPKGDPGNMERANAVAQQLRKLKVGSR